MGNNIKEMGNNIKEIDQMDHNEVFIIPALGRSISLGSLYDARNENFTMTSLLNKKDINDVIEINDLPGTHCDLISSDSYNEKFEKMNINGALKLSFLSDSGSISGAMKLEFLNNEKKTNKCLTTTLIYQISTKIETLRISDENMPKYITDKLECELNATHFVTGIKWGANVFATFEIETNKTKDETNLNAEVKAKFEFEGKLKMLSKLLKLDFGGATLTHEENSATGFNILKIKFESDVSISTIPQNMEDVLELLKKVPSDIERYNNGKGIQIEYTLLPIAYINSRFDKKLVIAKFVSIKNDYIIKNIENIFDQIRTLQADFNDFKNDIMESDVVSENDTNDMKTHGNLSSEIAKFKSELKQTLLKVRKSEEKEDVLLELIEQNNIQKWKIETQVSNYPTIKKNIEHSKEMKKAGFCFLQTDINATMLLRTPNMFVLYASKHCENYMSCVKTLKELKSMPQYSSFMFYVFDLDIHQTSEMGNDEKIKIKFYVDGILQYNNYDDELDLLLIKLKRHEMMKYDATLRNLVYEDKFDGKYRIKRCDKFKYEIDPEAIAYHIQFFAKNFQKVPENVWKELFNNSNDNKNNWPSVFKKVNKTARDEEIIRKFVGRWRADTFISPLRGFVTRNCPNSFGLWRWSYYARLFFSFENREHMKEYQDDYPDLLPEPGFVIYYEGNTSRSFDMFK